jgi:hypothetical protein
MFERVTTDPAFEQYTPKVLSRPSYEGNDTNETADYQLGPWVLILENYVSVEETEDDPWSEIGYNAVSVSESGPSWQTWS